MPTTAQVEKFRQRVKTKLLKRRESIAALARVLGLPRNSVSKAINRGCFPRVKNRISQHLHL